MANIPCMAERPELPDTGEISKTMAIRYLAPEIHRLQRQGFTLDKIRLLLEEGSLRVSVPLMVKALRPSSRMEGADG